MVDTSVQKRSLSIATGPESHLPCSVSCRVVDDLSTKPGIQIVSDEKYRGMEMLPCSSVNNPRSFNEDLHRANKAGGCVVSCPCTIWTIVLVLVEERGGFGKVGELETGQGAHLSLDILREKH